MRFSSRKPAPAAVQNTDTASTPLALALQVRPAIPARYRCRWCARTRTTAGHSRTAASASVHGGTADDHGINDDNCHAPHERYTCHVLALAAMAAVLAHHDQKADDAGQGGARRGIGRDDVVVNEKGQLLDRQLPACSNAYPRALDRPPHLSSSPLRPSAVQCAVYYLTDSERFGITFKERSIVDASIRTPKEPATGIPKQAEIEEIKQLHGQIQNAQCDTLKKALRIAEILLPVREHAKKNGNWLETQKAMQLGISQDTVENYLKVGERKQEFYKDGSTTELVVTSIAEALNFLAEKDGKPAQCKSPQPPQGAVRGRMEIAPRTRSVRTRGPLRRG